MSLHDDELEILLNAGVPIAGSREKLSISDLDRIRAIISKALKDQDDPKLKDACLGWLRAMRDHYPTLYGKHLNTPDIALCLNREINGREIKLRRLALSHISKVA